MLPTRAALMVTMTGDGLELSVGVALSQAALERPGPLDASRKIAYVVVGAADDLVLDVGCQPGDILVAGRLASTGLLGPKACHMGRITALTSEGRGSEGGLDRHCIGFEGRYE